MGNQALTLVITVPGDDQESPFNPDVSKGQLLLAQAFADSIDESTEMLLAGDYKIPEELPMGTTFCGLFGSPNITKKFERGGFTKETSRNGGINSREKQGHIVEVIMWKSLANERVVFATTEVQTVQHNTSPGRFQIYLPVKVVEKFGLEHLLTGKKAGRRLVLATESGMTWGEGRRVSITPRKDGLSFTSTGVLGPADAGGVHILDGSSGAKMEVTCKSLAGSEPRTGVAAEGGASGTSAASKGTKPGNKRPHQESRRCTVYYKGQLCDKDCEGSLLGCIIDKESWNPKRKPGDTSKDGQKVSSSGPKKGDPKKETIKDRREFAGHTFCKRCWSQYKREADPDKVTAPPS
jgi:hypothetical protein